MYVDTVTVFNRHEEDGLVWYPTVLKRVDLNADRAKIVERFGESCADRCLLHVKVKDGKVGGKALLDPLEYASTENPGECITFSSGEDFSFFCEGEYATGPISEDDYLDGFYNHMNATAGGVFVVASCARYSVIPHLEIVGR